MHTCGKKCNSTTICLSRGGSNKKSSSYISRCIRLQSHSLFILLLSGLCDYLQIMQPWNLPWKSNWGLRQKQGRSKQPTRVGISHPLQLPPFGPIFKQPMCRWGYNIFFYGFINAQIIWFYVSQLAEKYLFKYKTFKQFIYVSSTAPVVLSWDLKINFKQWVIIFKGILKE